MIDAIIGLFGYILSFIYGLFSNLMFLISVFIILYLMIVHNMNLIKSYTGSIIDRLKILTGDVATFTHTGTYQNMEYSLMIIGELNDKFHKFNYPTKAKMNFDDTDKMYRLENETPSKFVGWTILIWVGFKIVFFPYMCKKEKGDNI